MGRWRALDSVIKEVLKAVTSTVALINDKVDLLLPIDPDAVYFAMRLMHARLSSCVSLVVTRHVRHGDNCIKV